MTPEAQIYLKKLLDADSSKFLEICEEDRNGITSVILNQEALTAEEIDNLLYLAKNGSPTITIEYREDYDRGGPIHSHFFKANGNTCPKPKIHFSFSESQIKEAGWSYLNEKQLLRELANAEANEDYKLCAEIMNYAKLKEIDLNREK